MPPVPVFQNLQAPASSSSSTGFDFAADEDDFASIDLDAYQTSSSLPSYRPRPLERTSPHCITDSTRTCELQSASLIMSSLPSSTDAASTAGFSLCPH